MPDVWRDDGVPAARRVGRTRAPRAGLAHLLRGGSCLVNAVAGTGKSLLSRVYCDMRLADGGPGTTFYLVGPALAPGSSPGFRAFGSGEHVDLVATFDEERATAPPGTRFVLIVDEATLVDRYLELRYPDFHQVVLFGDLSQEVIEPGYMFGGFDPSDPRVPTMTLGTSMRGLNESRFAVSSFLSYSMALEEVPLAGVPFVDHVRMAPCGPSPAEAGAAAYTRAVRSMLVNPKMRTAVLLSDAGGASVVRDLAYVSPFKRIPFAVVDPANAQGFEADIVIVSTADVDRLVEGAWDAYVFLRMVFGRCRQRMEILVPEGADGPFTRTVALAVRFGIGFADPAELGFRAFSRALSEVGLACRATVEGLVVFSPPGHASAEDPGRDLSVVAFATRWDAGAEARRGLSALRGLPREVRHPDLLADGVFDPEEPWFARFIEAAAAA
jgi:hypothetical protein